MSRKRWFWLAAALVLLVTGLGASPPQSREVTYRRYDVDIVVRPDGSLFVTEKYRLAFGGVFHSGFAEIPLVHVTDIKNVQVWEGNTLYSPGDGERPATFRVEQDEEVVYVEWEFLTPTSGSTERTFTVSYLVEGGLSVYPDGVWLSWNAVPPDRSGILVENSRITVHLPVPLPISDLQLDTSGPEVATRRPNGQTVIFEAQEPLPDGMPFVVVVGMPPEFFTATAPGWQRERLRRR